MPRVFLWPADIAVRLFCLLFVITGMSATTVASEWKKTTTCAIGTDMPGFYRTPPTCWSLTEKGSSSVYAEDQIWESTRYWALAIVRLAGPFTVWRKSDPKTIFKGTSWWLDEQEAEMTRAAEKTVPIKLWINRAKSWDIESKDYGDTMATVALPSRAPAVHRMPATDRPISLRPSYAPRTRSLFR